MSLCLDQLLEQKKTAPFTLVNDSIQCAGVPLLAAFVQKALALDQQVICVLTETSPRRWLQHLKQSPGSPHRHLFIMDAFSDPEGWDKEHVLQPQQQRITLDRNMERQILPTIINRIEQAPNTLIVIDSLSPLSLISSHRTFQLVKALVSFTSDTIRVLAAYHHDQRAPAAALPGLGASLNRLASVIITLDAVPLAQADAQARLTGFVAQDTFGYMSVGANQATRGALANIEWRRKSGKVIYETNHFYMHTQRQQWVVAPFKHTDDDAFDDAAAAAPEPIADPTANLSFNLNLTDEQRKAKDSLVLPYLKAQQIEIDQPGIHPPAATATQTQPVGGAIFYEPDAADDFDDEDPDDDLDI